MEPNENSLKQDFISILKDILADHPAIVFDEAERFRAALEGAFAKRKNLPDGDKSRIRTVLNAAILDERAYSKLSSGHAAQGVFTPHGLADEMAAKGFEKAIALDLMLAIEAVARKKMNSGRALVAHKDAAIGDTIQFGSYTWQVLFVNKNDTDFSALIITENIIEQRAYHDRIADITWEKSSLRRYLNTAFVKNFSESDQKRIIEITVRNRDNDLKYITQMRAQKGMIPTVAGGEDTKDKIFLLSIDEVRNLMPNESARAAKYNGNESEWWLRSPGDQENCASHIFRDGFIRYSGGFVGYTTYGLRPVLRLNLV